MLVESDNPHEDVYYWIKDMELLGNVYR